MEALVNKNNTATPTLQP